MSSVRSSVNWLVHAVQNMQDRTCKEPLDAAAACGAGALAGWERVLLEDRRASSRNNA